MQQLMLDAIKNFTLTTYIIVFAGAALLSMGSCVWIRIPVVAGYVGGTATSRKSSFVLTLAFVAGCVFCYVCLGVLLGTVGAMATHLLYLSTFLYYAVGIVLILIGLSLLKIIRIRSPESRMELRQGRRRTVVGAFFLGMTFAFLEAPACPCCGPILLLLAMETFPSGNYMHGINLFLAYALGQNLPVMLIGGATGMLKPLERQALRLEGLINVGGGYVLSLLGLFFVWMA
jgi:cytochrome c biogenesis protein CcdA